MSGVNKQLLNRWAAFGKAMQKAGSKLPRHLIAETEQAIAAAEQAQQAEPVAADPAVAAIQFALETHSDGLHFLRLWNEGEFDLLRREWPEAPEDIYIGADPLLDAPAQPPAVADNSCKFPLCQNEQYQKDLAEQLHRELYSGVSAVPDGYAQKGGAM